MNSARSGDAVPDAAVFASATWEEEGSRGVAAVGRTGWREEDAMSAVELFFRGGGALYSVVGGLGLFLFFGRISSDYS